MQRSEKKISFAGPSITQKELDYVADAVKNGWYETFHMHVQKLRAAVTGYLGVKYAHPTHCCTLALHLSAAALGLKEGVADGRRSSAVTPAVQQRWKRYPSAVHPCRIDPCLSPNAE